MNFRRPAHLTDEVLVLAMDGELSTRHQQASNRHLSQCEHCRLRLSQLESAAREGMRAFTEKRAPSWIPKALQTGRGDRSG